MIKHRTLLFTWISLTILPGASWAEEVVCTVKKNGVEASQKTLSVEPAAAAAFAEVDGFRMKLLNAGKSKFEIDVFDVSVPSRSYAAGYLRAAEDEVAWTLWTREILLEASCRLL